MTDPDQPRSVVRCRLGCGGEWWSTDQDEHHRPWCPSYAGRHHRATATFPVPSGWRVICTCGHEARGMDRAQALDRFFDHCENDHAVWVEEVGE